jgi:FixJ family two-component response regulator
LNSPARPAGDPSLDPIVYVLDDEAAIATALCGLLRSVGLGAVPFHTAQEFLAYHRPEAPSCLVLDVRLRGSSGLALQDHLNAMQDPLPVIFITGHGDIPMTVRVMKAGAADFLTKPFRDQDFLDAVAASLERDRQRRAQRRCADDLAARYQLLSAREREVMQHAASGLMNKQIADRLGISEVTVKIHRGNAMRKMQARTFADLVIMAREVGATDAEPAQPLSAGDARRAA